MKKAFPAVVLVVMSVGWGLGQRAGSDLLQRRLFAPDLIMRNQRTLGITEEQRNYIVGQIEETQSGFTSLQWRLQREVEGLSDVLDDAEAGEDQIVSQLDQVLDLEKEIKRNRLLLAVRIKNRLTAEQRAQLGRMRNQDQRRRDGPVRSQPRRRPRQ